MAEKRTKEEKLCLEKRRWVMTAHFRRRLRSLLEPSHFFNEAKTAQVQIRDFCCSFIEDDKFCCFIPSPTIVITHDSKPCNLRLFFKIDRLDIDQHCQVDEMFANSVIRDQQSIHILYMKWEGLLNPPTPDTVSNEESVGVNEVWLARDGPQLVWLPALHIVAHIHRCWSKVAWQLLQFSALLISKRRPRRAIELIGLEMNKCLRQKKQIWRNFCAKVFPML